MFWFPTDSSGSILQHEFVSAVQKKPHFRKIQDGEIKALFKSIPRANASSKQISFDEFMSWLAEHKLEPAKEYELEWERAEVCFPFLAPVDPRVIFTHLRSLLLTTCSIIQDTKKQSTIKIGQYHITGEPRPCRYAFVHKGVLVRKQPLLQRYLNKLGTGISQFQCDRHI